MKGFAIDDLGHFDDEALRTFLDPRDGGVDPAELGCSLSRSDAALQQRVANALPEVARRVFAAALSRRSRDRDITTASQRVLDVLFWPLVYWCRPDDYEELINGEAIHERILDELDVTDAVVCDIGAGSGRFTLPAARRARRVIAVDEVPALLERLAAKIAREGLRNVDVRRGSFGALPLDAGSVDCAVACSSFTTRGPHGGERALAECERIVRSGGQIAVIWPQQPEWFVERGCEHVHVRGGATRSFTDVETAVRMCETYYSPAAAGWVREHETATVPYSVLGVAPPNDICIKHVD